MTQRTRVWTEKTIVYSQQKQVNEKKETRERRQFWSRKIRESKEIEINVSSSEKQTLMKSCLQGQHIHLFPTQSNDDHQLRTWEDDKDTRHNVIGYHWFVLPGCDLHSHVGIFTDYFFTEYRQRTEEEGRLRIPDDSQTHLNYSFHHWESIEFFQEILRITVRHVIEHIYWNVRSSKIIRYRWTRHALVETWKDWSPDGRSVICSKWRITCRRHNEKDDEAMGYQADFDVRSSKSDEHDSTLWRIIQKSIFFPETHTSQIYYTNVLSIRWRIVHVKTETNLYWGWVKLKGIESDICQTKDHDPMISCFWYLFGFWNIFDINPIKYDERYMMNIKWLVFIIITSSSL